MLGMLLGSVFSGLFGASSAKNATKAQTAAADKSNALQRYIFDKSVSLTDPQRRMGLGAMNALSKLYARGIPAQPSVTGNVGGIAMPKATGFNPSPGAFHADPGYKFQLTQGQQAIDRTAAARGMRMGGATMKAQMQYGQGMADQSYGNWFDRAQQNYFANYNQKYGQYIDAYNRAAGQRGDAVNVLSGLAGIGQSATQSQIGAGQAYGANAGSNILSAGQARASGYSAQNDAFQGTMNNLFQIYGMNKAGMFQ